MSRPNCLIRSAVLLSCSLALFPLAPVAAIATPRASDPLLAQVLFKPPGDGEPDDTASGASRPNLRLCPEDAEAPSKPLMVLRPQSSSVPQVDRTLTARPTLVAYLPATEARELQVRLYARDAATDYDYSTTVKLTASDSMIRIPLPASFPDLEPGRTYTWVVAAMCGPDALDPSSQTVQGSFAYRTLPAAAELPDEPLARAAWYGDRGLWLDALATLAELKQTLPNQPEVAANWRSLLAVAGFADTYAELAVTEARELETANY